MACLFGHKWKGCTCEKCHKTRDRDHHYQPGDKPCVFVCTECGKEKIEHGRFINGFCERCGAPNEYPVDFSVLTDDEAAEIMNVMCGYVQDRLGPNGATPAAQEHVGTRLSLMYAMEHIYSYCPRGEEMLDTARAYMRNPKGQVTLSNGKNAVIIIKSAVKTLNEKMTRVAPDGVAPAVSGASTCKSLVELEKQPPESSNPLAWSRELYKTGMRLNVQKSFTPIRGTIDLLNSALQKTEEQISAFEEETARRGIPQADPADSAG